MVHVSNLLRSPHVDIHARFGSARFAVNESCSNDTGNNPRSLPSNLNAMDKAPSTSRTQEEEEEEEEGGRRAEQGDVPSSSSADWLRLGLGGASSSAEAEPPGGRRQAPTELQLFVDRPSSSSSSVVPPWRSLSTPPPAQFTSQAGTSAGAAEGRSEMRVVSPPRRQMGIWLMLQAAAIQSQGRQPFLPQIPRNYLRIKDESMTIRLLMRYVANKLGLGDELEVEITCRDQVLLPSMSLQHVRDNIWYSGDAPPVFPDSPGIDHVMTLQYRRSTSTSGSH